MSSGSPFPGMDPYLEGHWLDVHARLVLYGCDQLQPQLGGSLRARVEERLVVEAGDEGDGRDVYPDVRIVERGVGGRPVKAVAGVAVAEPVVIRIPEHERRVETSIKVIDVAQGGRVVTVIEFLSVTNKTPGEGMRQYQRKQRELLEGGANLVEVDLLRGGRREFHSPEIRVPAGQRTAYCACVRRASAAGQYELYAMGLREPLAAIRVPLRAEDPDVVLDLQGLVRRAYENGAYDDIDYSKACEPALEGEDADWAEELLRKAGRR